VPSVTGTIFQTCSNTSPRSSSNTVGPTKFDISAFFLIKMSCYTCKFEAISTLSVSFDDFYVVEPAGANPHDTFDHLYMGRNGIWHIIFTAPDPSFFRSLKPSRRSSDLSRTKTSRFKLRTIPTDGCFSTSRTFRLQTPPSMSPRCTGPARRDSTSPTPSLTRSYRHDVPDESFAYRLLIRLGGSSSTPIPPSPSSSSSLSFTWPTATGPDFFYRFYEQEEMAVDITYLGRTLRLKRGL
jgi:hypothetical protein